SQVDKIDTARSTPDKRSPGSKEDSTRSRTRGSRGSRRRGASPSHRSRKPRANRHGDTGGRRWSRVRRQRLHADELSWFGLDERLGEGAGSCASYATPSASAW